MNQMSVVYCSDAHDYRKKTCGLNLLDQCLTSVESLRSNWSNEIDVFLIHTADLPTPSKRQLGLLKVKTILGKGPLQAGFLLANKILVGRDYDGTNDLLFLDCDTRVHRAPVFDRRKDIVVSFDA